MPSATQAIFQLRPSSISGSGSAKLSARAHSHFKLRPSPISSSSPGSTQAKLIPCPSSDAGQVSSPGPVSSSSPVSGPLPDSAALFPETFPAQAHAWLRLRLISSTRPVPFPVRYSFRLGSSPSMKPTTRPGPIASTNRKPRAISWSGPFPEE